MKYFKTICFILLFIMAQMSSANISPSQKSNSSNNLQNYSEPNSTYLKKKLSRLSVHPPEQLIITMLGDSHVAADLFSGQLRTELQNKLGNAGIGWIPPIAIPGQYHTAIKWQSRGWDLISSKNNDGDFTLGGFIARAKNNKSYIKLIPILPIDANQIWNVKIILKTPVNNRTVKLFNFKNQSVNLFQKKATKNKWTQITAKTTLPLTIRTSLKNLDIAGIWLEQANKKGAIVSTIGTNGAQLSFIDKWSSNWKTQLAATHSDLVILEYGTNEAFNSSLDITQFKTNLIQKIKIIRKLLPKAAILIISPPDTIDKSSDDTLCSLRSPLYYHQIQNTLKDVAKSQHTLYWDWQKAMGGPCVITEWAKEELARPDLIHFTRKGYELTAKQLYQDLIVTFK